MGNSDKSRKAFEFFCNAEQTGQVFQLPDIAAATGWSLGTVKTYRSKRWHFFIKEVQEGFCVKGLIGISEDSFIRLQMQKIDLSGDVLRPRFGSTVDALLDKSRESALLAVQIYNNPLVSFRTPGYIVQMIIAYTALFHAIFEKRGVDYTYKTKDGKPKIIDGEVSAWDVSKCSSVYYAGQTVPESENLRFILLLRNKIEHRHIPALDATLSGRCQALLMNYENLLTKEFGEFFALGSNLALALQFSMYTNDQRIAIRRVQSQEFEAVRRFIQDFDSPLKAEITQSPKYSFRAYLIPKMGNHAKSSDLAIEWVHYDPNNAEEMEKYDSVVGIIRDRHIPVANECNIAATEVWKRIAAATGKKFNQSDHVKAWKLYQVRPKHNGPDGCKLEFCDYFPQFKQFGYSEKWVKFLCDKVNDPVEYERIRNYRESE